MKKPNRSRQMASGLGVMVIIGAAPTIHLWKEWHETHPLWGWAAIVLEAGAFALAAYLGAKGSKEPRVAE